MAIAVDTQPQPQGRRQMERLYRRYAPEVYALSRSMLGSREDAEDATQTVFLSAWRAMRAGQQPREPRAWLLTIARNVCRSAFRARGRRPYERGLDHDVAGVSPDDDCPNAQQLAAALRELEPRQRKALVLRALEGRSQAAIARHLGISPLAAQSLVARARNRLREELDAAEQPVECEQVPKLVEDQLQGPLPSRERRALRAHLRRCPACGRTARSLRAQRRMPVLGLPPPLGALANLCASVGRSCASVGATGLAEAAAIGGIGLGAGLVVPHRLRVESHLVSPPEISASLQLDLPSRPGSVAAPRPVSLPAQAARTELPRFRPAPPRPAPLMTPRTDAPRPDAQRDRPPSLAPPEPAPAASPPTRTERTPSPIGQPNRPSAPSLPAPRRPEPTSPPSVAAPAFEPPLAAPPSLAAPELPQEAPPKSPLPLSPP